MVFQGLLLLASVVSRVLLLVAAAGAAGVKGGGRWLQPHVNADLEGVAQAQAEAAARQEARAGRLAGTGLHHQEHLGRGCRRGARRLGVTVSADAAACHGLRVSGWRMRLLPRRS